MLRHVAVFTWRSGTTDDDVAAICAALTALPEKIPEIRTYRFGPDLGLGDGNWDFAVVADFDNADDFRVYRDHAAHQDVIADEIAPRREYRASLQFEIPD